MIKVSLIGYAVGGAFLSLAYFDLPYYLLVLAVASREWVKTVPLQVAARTETWRRPMTEDGTVIARSPAEPAPIVSAAVKRFG